MKKLKFLLGLIVSNSAAMIFLGFYKSLYWPSSSSQPNSRILEEDVMSPKYGVHFKQCKLPKLDPFSEEIQSFVKNPGPFDCKKGMRDTFKGKVFQIENGNLLMRTRDLGVPCCYQPFYRMSDVENRVDEKCHKITGLITEIPAGVNFFEVHCISSNFTYRDVFAVVSEKSKVERRVRQFEDRVGVGISKEDRDDLSVLIIGIDSVSKSNFLRKMNKSHTYLVETLKAIQLEGYTKVGENTALNLIPLLTGMTREELAAHCLDETKGIANIRFDNCPFVWKIFESNGYRTGFTEDAMKISIFNLYYDTPFDYPITDYDFRPYTLQMEDKQTGYSHSNGYCYGHRHSIEGLLDNTKLMSDVFRNRRYFMFMWATKMAHTDSNFLRNGDDILLNHLQYLTARDLLNDTALILISDHGWRNDNFVKTQTGFYEVRMPFAYIVLPVWFERKYGTAYSNLMSNSVKITSPYDIYKTLLDFMKLNRFKDDGAILPNSLFSRINERMANRGISLLEQIPRNRTCFMAGIPLYWCICHRKVVLNTSLEIVKTAAATVVNVLNNKLIKYRNMCSFWTLRAIESAYLINLEKDEVLDDKYCNSSVSNAKQISDWKRKCGNHTFPLVTIILVGIRVSPENALFETAVVVLESGQVLVPEEVVRIGWYDHTGRCAHRMIKPICHCKYRANWGW